MCPLDSAFPEEGSQTSALEKSAVEGHDALNRILTGNEFWSYHVDAEESFKNTKPKTKPSPRQSIRTVFWDAGGRILPQFLRQDEITNVVRCLQMLQKAVTNVQGTKTSSCNTATQGHTLLI